MLRACRWLGRAINRKLTWVFFRCQTLQTYGKPVDAIFEMSNQCNLRCALCNTGALRGLFPQVARGNMDFGTFKTCLDKLLPQLENVYLYAWGEPFLNKDLVRCVRYAHSQDVRTQISTNMNLYTDDYGGGLIEAGLDNLIVSCDGLSQSTYERYRVGGSLAKVSEGVTSFLQLRAAHRSSKPHVEMQFIVFRHNEHEMDEYKRYWIHRGVDCVSFIPMSFLSGRGEELARQNGFVPNNPQFQPFHPYGAVERCQFLYSHVTINFNGDWYTCCFPCGQARYRAGNLVTDEFWSVWNGEYYRYCRAIFRSRTTPSGEYDSVCHDCSGRFPHGCQSHYWNRGTS